MVRTANDSIIEIKGVSKIFDGVVQALDDVNIAIGENEIVGVVGENGAGKSTLMKILVGVFSPDEGELYYRGEKVSFPDNPKAAAKRGISIVYQEKGVIPHLHVYQFLLIGHEDMFMEKFRLQIDKMKERAGKILQELHVECDVESYMYELPLSTQKMIEIARAILSVRLEYGDGNKGNNEVPSIIILDEPTAPLSREESRELLDYLLKMKENASFIFVSHIIPEVMEFTDKVHVLRDGKMVAHYDLSRDNLTEEDMFRAIVGKESSEYIDRSEEKRDISGEVVLTAKNLIRHGSYRDISFQLHKGECIGIFGTAGSGKSQLINSIAGRINFDEGKLIIKGNEAHLREPPHVRLKKGIGYFSGETSKELFLDWSIARNISMVNIEKVLSNFLRVINFNAERQMGEKISERLKIKAPDVNTECYSLSGGNKQKVSVGKWFERSPDILLLEDPTIGIDVGSRRDIYEATLEMKDKGISMILVSDDPKEYSALCDRIMFIRNGEIEKFLNPEEFKEVMSA